MNAFCTVNAQRIQCGGIDVRDPEPVIRFNVAVAHVFNH
jgi:hypothetical protein